MCKNNELGCNRSLMLFDLLAVGDPHENLAKLPMKVTKLLLLRSWGARKIHFGVNGHGPFVPCSGAGKPRDEGIAASQTENRRAAFICLSRTASGELL